ncbi:MAG: methylmalonyl Co-A mutase-associated GTPase MeaB, partial [Pseudomonadota bacterium]
MEAGAIDALMKGIRAGERRALARGITLVESRAAAPRGAARRLLSALA